MMAGDVIAFLSLREKFVKAYEKGLRKYWSDLTEEAARKRWKTDETTWRMETFTRAYREVKRQHLLALESTMYQCLGCDDSAEWLKRLKATHAAVRENEMQEFEEALRRQRWWVTDCTTVGHA